MERSTKASLIVLRGLRGKGMEKIGGRERSRERGRGDRPFSPGFPLSLSLSLSLSLPLFLSLLHQSLLTRTICQVHALSNSPHVELTEHTHHNMLQSLIFTHSWCHMETISHKVSGRRFCYDCCFLVVVLRCCHASKPVRAER